MEKAFGKLVLTQEGLPEQQYELNKGQVTIGRGMTNDIVVNDARISRTHAQIECSSSGCKLVDLGSSNGSRLNGLEVDKAELKPGDILMMGNTTFRFEPYSEIHLADMTRIDTESELDLTLEREVLPVSINETSTPHLVVFTKEKTWEVDLEDIDRLMIGRTDENDVVLSQANVSRQHAQITRKGNYFVLKDLNSTNGTWQRDQRLDEVILQSGVPIRIGQAQLIFKGGFSAEALTMAGELLSLSSPRRPVIFIPGIMGSDLWLGNERVWPSVKTLFTRPEIFRFDSKYPLEARGIVNEVVIVPNLLKLDQYNRLGDYLVEDLGYERGVDFFEFAYDWRQDVRQSASLLAHFIDNLSLRQPAILIGHSLGTLISRYYIECLRGKEKVERVILLGGPHKGAPKALISLLLAPEMLPFGLMGERMRQILVTFPSGYQVLPEYICAKDQNGEDVDLFANDRWLPLEHRSFLQAAREFRRELGLRSSVPAVSVFGYGLKTVTEVKLSRLDGRDSFGDIHYHQQSAGDNSVPQFSSVLENSEIHPVQQHHGALFTDNDVKMRLKLELTRMI